MSVQTLPRHDNPALDGNNAPVGDEVVAAELKVVGDLPTDLNGVYVRNGPNAYYTPDWRYHAYDGDGMLHAAYFDKGRVTYRNAWIGTNSLREEQRAGRSLWKGLKEPPRRERPDEPFKNTSNTDVKFHAGKLLTMWYGSGTPYHVDLATLKTIGPASYDGALGRISAHSRPDEHTGELIWFDYGQKPPYMEYGVIGPDGQSRTRIPIRLPGPRLPHDMAVTEHYSILHDFPLFLDEEARKQGRHKVAFHRDLPSRFAIVPRHGTDRDVRWFEAKPTYMLHVVNAWEEGDEVVMIGTPYRVHQGADGGLDGERLCRTIRKRQRDFMLYQWRFNLATGRTEEGVLDDVLNTEFPVINSAYQGRKNRYTYNIVFAPGGEEEPRFPGLVKHDLETGAFRAFSEGRGFFYNEPGFAPRDNPKAEDDGYLVLFAWNPREQRSEIQVYDCHDDRFAAGPRARVLLPQRVPNGFHATFVSAARIASGK